MQYIWRETSRIVIGWLQGCHNYAEFMDGMCTPGAALSPTDVAIAHFQELVSSLLGACSLREHACSETALVADSRCMSLQASIQLSCHQAGSLAAAAQTFLETMLHLQQQRAACLATLCKVTDAVHDGAEYFCRTSTGPIRAASCLA